MLNACYRTMYKLRIFWCLGYCTFKVISASLNRHVQKSDINRQLQMKHKRRSQIQQDCTTEESDSEEEESVARTKKKPQTRFSITVQTSSLHQCICLDSRQGVLFCRLTIFVILLPPQV